MTGFKEQKYATALGSGTLNVENCPVYEEMCTEYTDLRPQSRWTTASCRHLSKWAPTCGAFSPPISRRMDPSCPVIQEISHGEDGES